MSVSIVCDGPCRRPLAPSNVYAGIAVGVYPVAMRPWTSPSPGERRSWLAEVCGECMAPYLDGLERYKRRAWERRKAKVPAHCDGGPSDLEWSCEVCRAELREGAFYADVYVEAWMWPRIRLYTQAWVREGDSYWESGMWCARLPICLDCLPSTPFRERGT